MNRFAKFIGILFIAIIVSFIICDEKGINFERNKGKLIVHKQETSFGNTGSKEVLRPVALYKNSDLIRINPEFKNPKTLRKSLDVDSDFLEKRKAERENRKKSVSLDGDSVTSILYEYETTKTGDTVTRTGNAVVKTGNTTARTGNNATKTGNIEVKTGNTAVRTGNIVKTGNTIQKTGNNKPSVNTGKTISKNTKVSVKKYQWDGNDLVLKLGKQPIEIKEKVDSYKGTQTDINLNGSVKVETPVEETKEKVESYKWESVALNLSTIKEPQEQEPQKQKNISTTTKANLGDKEISNIISNNIEKIDNNIEQDTSNSIKEIDNSQNEEDTGNSVIYVEKIVGNTITSSLKKSKKPTTEKANLYIGKSLPIALKKAKRVEKDTAEINEEKEEFGFSEELLSSLMENEEIDINTLESENDEFLQKVFQETGDPKIMNLILETYISEYQFVKAKKFIESLPETYLNQINPLSYLQVSFNSFSLSSNTTNDTLSSIVKQYQSAGKISDEDATRYEGIIYLMNKDYDKFFEIAQGFTSDNHTNLVARLNGYKDQIKTQMGMPDYYFDTLVALELFNQGLFQPAKVLSLSSLTKDPNYILPYQVLAYANFLTNSWDTSIEYLKKLVELDPDNVEKYRFLIGIAYYRAEDYEQSVLMLSSIRNESLRLDVERYLIRDYIILNQKTKLISSWSKLLGYDNLVSSDFYTYFYETFYHPYSEGNSFELYLDDRDLADKMIRVCSMKLGNEERVVCNYGEIGKDIALGKFDNLEQSLLDLIEDYPQGYLYQALGDYYIKQGELEKAKAYLIKAISMSQERGEIMQIKKMLQDII